MEEFNLWTRRRFISTGSKLVAAGAIVGIPEEAFASGAPHQLVILHTNDTHSRIDPFPLDDPKFPGLGGVARRMELIRQIRSENKEVLLLDSGDIFQGTPYFNLYGGELEFKLMSYMRYDAATMGNHDFDNGITGFDKQLPHADFPFLCANYNFQSTILAGKTLPYKCFQKGAIKVGVFGIGIQLEGLVDEKLYGQTKYEDPIERSNSIADHLRMNEKCHLIICLSHLGYQYSGTTKPSDVLLAQQSRNIDLILGGHTHTFLDSPAEYSNISGNKVLVAQTGWAGIRLGRIDYLFERKSMKKFSSGHTVKISTKSS